MTDFAEETFNRVRQEYAEVDVGPGALFAVIADHLMRGQSEFPLIVALQSMDIFSPGDQFIDEEHTTHTDVFLEVFRRSAFMPLPAQASEEERTIWRRRVVGAASYLSNFLHNILQQS